MEPITFSAFVVKFVFQCVLRHVFEFNIIQYKQNVYMSNAKCIQSLWL